MSQALGFVIALEGYMTCTAGWLSVTALVFLIVINAFANGCRVAVERDAELRHGADRAVKQRRGSPRSAAPQRTSWPGALRIERRLSDPLTRAQRIAAGNGIWMCHRCGRLVDNDAKTSSCAASEPVDLRDQFGSDEPRDDGSGGAGILWISRDQNALAI